MITKLLTIDLLTPEIQEQIEALFKQLSANKKQLSIGEILDAKNTTIAYCMINNTVAGFALMANYKVISGNKGWIEDVVVDKQHRGKGIGQKLIELLIETGQKNQMSEILLFTETEKKSAIRLYTKLGFKEKESQMFNLKLK